MSDGVSQRVGSSWGKVTLHCLGACDRTSGLHRCWKVHSKSFWSIVYVLSVPCRACQPLSMPAPPYVENDMRLMEQGDVPQSCSISLNSLDALVLEYVRDEQLSDVRSSL